MKAVFYPLSIALVSFFISVFLYLRWSHYRRKNTLLWCFGFFSYFLSYLIGALFVNGMIAQEFIFMHLIRQILVAVMFVVFYLGVVILFTKRKILTIYFPLIFFVLQLVQLFYYDFALGNTALGERAHIIYFDIPFNIVIGVLFIFYFWASRKRYLLYFLAGWIGDAIVMGLTVYSRYNFSSGFFSSDMFFLISMLPTVFLFLGVADYFRKPYADNVLDISPALEKISYKTIEHEIEPGWAYLIEEDKSKRAFGAFSDIVKMGVYGLCITRGNPADVRKKYLLKKTPIIQLTKSGRGNAIEPEALERIYYTIEKFILTADSGKRIKNIVLLDGIEYLSTNNSFEKVLNFIQLLKDRISETNAAMIVPINPESIEKNQIEILEKELKYY